MSLGEIGLNSSESTLLFLSSHVSAIRTAQQFLAGACARSDAHTERLTLRATTCFPGPARLASARALLVVLGAAPAVSAENLIGCSH